MFTTNDEARAALFGGFDAFQARFFAMLDAHAKTSDDAERATLATAFVKEVAIPYLDGPKDALFKEILPPLLAIDAEIGKLGHVFGGVEG
jgi:hypothetical protein